MCELAMGVVEQWAIIFGFLANILDSNKLVSRVMQIWPLNMRKTRIR